ncbi:DUF47 domain-containing protein [Thermodesulfobacteriota bacterium]
MFFKKEKEVIDLISQYLDEVEKCVLTAHKGIEAYLEGDMGSARVLSQKASDSETTADLSRHRIRDKLYSGAYLPLIREDIYTMVESIDKVANAGEACIKFFLNQRPEIPDALKAPFLAAVRESFDAVGPLHEAVKCFLQRDCTTDRVREMARSVGNIESKVDRIEWELTKNIFTASLEHSRMLHLRLCLDNIVEISDRAEDAADRLELVTLKSVS